MFIAFGPSIIGLLKYQAGPFIEIHALHQFNFGFLGVTHQKKKMLAFCSYMITEFNLEYSYKSLYSSFKLVLNYLVY